MERGSKQERKRKGGRLNYFKCWTWSWFIDRWPTAFKASAQTFCLWIPVFLCMYIFSFIVVCFCCNKDESLCDNMRDARAGGRWDGAQDMFDVKCPIYSCDACGGLLKWENKGFGLFSELVYFCSFSMSVYLLTSHLKSLVSIPSKTSVIETLYHPMSINTSLKHTPAHTHTVKSVIL